MPTSRSDIEQWFQRGLAENATHMVIVCDTFDFEDFPIYEESSKAARETAKEYESKEGYRLMEVYDLAMDMDAQLTPGTRVLNY